MSVALGKLLVTAQEAASILSVSVWQVYDLASAGRLEKRFIGNGKRQYRIPVASLQAYVDSLPTEPREDE